MELDKKDRQIICTLDFDARMPLSTLAKKLSISKQVAKYRIDNLIKNQVIQGFYTDINPSRLGFDIYLVYLAFQHLSPVKEQELIAHLAHQEGVGLNVSTTGAWNHTLGIWAKSIVHFKNQYKNIMKNYEEFISSKTIMIQTDFFYFKPKQIYEENSSKIIVMKGSEETVSIDKVDSVILRELSQDARVLLVDVSAKVKLTPTAVKDRIKRLEKEKVILGYRVMINYPLLNFLHYRVFLKMDHLTEKIDNKFIEYLGSRKEIVSITRTIGFCELEFRAIVKDIHEFYALMDQLRKEFQANIKSYDSILYYKFHNTLNYYPFS